jgi:hypothetical protein
VSRPTSQLPRKFSQTLVSAEENDSHLLVAVSHALPSSSIKPSSAPIASSWSHFARHVTEKSIKFKPSDPAARYESTFLLCREGGRKNLMVV